MIDILVMAGSSDIVVDISEFLSDQTFTLTSESKSLVITFELTEKRS